MDDVVDELVGDVTENYQDEYKIVKRNENSWLVDGQYSLLDFVKYFDLNLSDEQHNKFTTVAGLIIHKTSQVPDIGDKVQIENYELELLSYRAMPLLIISNLILSFKYYFPKAVYL